MRLSLSFNVDMIDNNFHYLSRIRRISIIFGDCDGEDPIPKKGNSFQLMSKMGMMYPKMNDSRIPLQRHNPGSVVVTDGIGVLCHRLSATTSDIIAMGSITDLTQVPGARFTLPVLSLQCLYSICKVLLLSYGS